MKKRPSSFLVRLPNWIGDAVMATPVLLALRDHFPYATISCMGTPAIVELLHSFPGISNWYTLHEQIPSHEVGLLLTRSFSSAWNFFKKKLPIRIGFTGHYRRFLLTHPISPPETEEYEHAVLTYLRLVEIITSGPAPRYNPQLFVTEEQIQEVAMTLEQHDITPHHVLIGINPGAAYGSAKCWPKERFRQVAKALLEQPNIRLLFFGDRATKPLVDEICARLPPRVINLSGKTSITQLKCYLQRLTLLLTNDSGPMHMASALGVPTVAIFGSTNPTKTGPWSNGIVVQHKTACSPCYLRKCPIDFRCMLHVTTEMVLNQITALLDRAKYDLPR